MSQTIFESALEPVRRSFGLQVYGYVVMPEHVHLLFSEPHRDASSSGTAPLNPKDGLNGPPSDKDGFGAQAASPASAAFSPRLL
ncbi:MAG TPA: hypothetical protein VI386_12685 [Candidatus Sulfotelmatobacter sp.]